MSTQAAGAGVEVVGASSAMQSRAAVSSSIVSPEWVVAEWKFLQRGQEWSIVR